MRPVAIHWALQFSIFNVDLPLWFEYRFGTIAFPRGTSVLPYPSSFSILLGERWVKDVHQCSWCYFSCFCFDCILLLIAYYYTAALKSGLARNFQSPAASFTEILIVDINEQCQSRVRFFKSLPSRLHCTTQEETKHSWGGNTRIACTLQTCRVG